MEQNKYQRGVIYAIRSHKTNDVYIGSTTQPLHKRLHQHKCYMKSNQYVSSAEILKYDDGYIELVENFPCNSKAELNKREGWYIRHSDCVNKNVAGRTKNEYFEDHKEHLIEYKKNWKEDNKEKIAETSRAYYIANKERIDKKNKEYYEKKKAQLYAGSVSLS